MSIPTTTNETTQVTSPGPRPPAMPTTDVAPKEAAEVESNPDIEHVPVDDDPRKWSRIRKARGYLDNFGTRTVNMFDRRPRCGSYLWRL